MSQVLLWNSTLFQDLNSYVGQNSLLDSLMIFCAEYLIFLWPLLLLVIWGIPLAWRKQGLKQSPSNETAEVLHRRRAAVLWVPVACVVGYGLNLLLEQFIFEPRPFDTKGLRDHVLISHAHDASFPSDHAAWSFAVVGTLICILLPFVINRHRDRVKGVVEVKEKYWPRLIWFIIIAFVVACSIGIARVFVGVHYPGDILGGAIDGLIGGVIVALLYRWLWKPTDAVLRFARKIRLA